MKYLLIAYTLFIALTMQKLQAKTPYDNMLGIESSIKSADEKKKVAYSLQLLSLATLGHTELGIKDGLQTLEDMAMINKGAHLNLTQDRLHAKEKYIHISAIATAAWIIPQLGAKPAYTFLDNLLRRENLAPYEYDHILMVRIIFGAASRYFHDPETKIASDGFLNTLNVQLFRTRCFDNSKDLVNFLNDFSDNASPNPGSLTDLFDAVNKVIINSFFATTAGSITAATPKNPGPVPNENAPVAAAAPDSNGAAVEPPPPAANSAPDFPAPIAPKPFQRASAVTADTTAAATGNELLAAIKRVKLKSVAKDQAAVAPGSTAAPMARLAAVGNNSKTTAAAPPKPAPKTASESAASAKGPTQAFVTIFQALMKREMDKRRPGIDSDNEDDWSDND